jgi:hypothetical protein
MANVVPLETVSLCPSVKREFTGYDCTNIFEKEHFNKYYLIPHDVTALFTGRNDVCALLQMHCLPSPSPKQQHRFVLHGLGGSGKTQVALKFAQDHRER